MEAFVVPDVESNEDVEDPEKAAKNNRKAQNYVFNHVVSARHVLQMNCEKSVEKTCQLIEILTKEGLVKPELLTESLVGLFRYEWTQVSFNG